MENLKGLQLCIIRMVIYIMEIYIKESKMVKELFIIIIIKNGIGINIKMEN